MKKYNYVYRIINLNPQDKRKYYIGVRSCDCLPEEDTKYMSSSKYLKEAISEQGQENFKKEILSIWETRKEAVEEEIRLHSEFEVAKNNDFYNKSKQTSTGFDTTNLPTELHPLYGKKHSEETKNKIRNYNLGKTYSKETNLKKGVKGKKLSDKHKKAIGFNNKGKIMSDEVKEKMSKSRKGKPLTEKHKKALSKVRKESNNPAAAKILIFNSSDELVFECHGNFMKVCKENNLPADALQQSYLNDGKPIYSSNYGKACAIKRNKEFLIGWYAQRL